ncbi:nitrite/sulfite reductase [Candidatus Nitrosocosmicus sp. SS]|nr:nitrite/sulfite reductase [Candidatus Nitrosocosmicus sp. SS]KAF0870262.1 nitrite/sulfite reductase [Candidatus Nitrosocosmicus sp. SS]
MEYDVLSSSKKKDQDTNEKWGLAEESEYFANKVKLYRQDKLNADEFRRFRLQNGAYGSRLNSEFSMIRIKVPGGDITPSQMEKIASLSESFSIGSAHVSTRQNIQLHWVQLEDVSEVFRGLAEVGLTSREACGNTIRNVMCSHFAGVCPNEPFDTTPHAKAIARFFLRNPICQNLPRKFKFNFSCCAEHGYVRIADVGLVPTIKDGIRGFRIYLGGGLGAASFIGHLLEEFTPESRLLSTSIATIRLYDRLGNRENLARNRMRYLVSEIGWEKFQELLLKERILVEATISIPTKTTFDGFLRSSSKAGDLAINQSTLNSRGKKLPVINSGSSNSPYDRWLNTNVVAQKQPGLYSAYITLGAGDITANQLRVLAECLREFSMEKKARTTPQQNFLIRYIKADQLPKIYNRLSGIGLGNPGANTIVSTVGCSGTTSCNLAITNSHRLAKEIQSKFLELNIDTDHDFVDSTIKISGCPNSCGQHEVATIGFYGGASRIGTSMVPIYTMLFAGSTGESGELGKAVMRVPSKKVIDVVMKIIEIYKKEKTNGEKLNEWIHKVSVGSGTNGVKNMEDMKKILSPIIELPPLTSAPEFYKDYGNDTNFVAKTARGECAA